MQAPAPAGLRELKKQRTRDSIASAATELFLAQGFEVVTVAAVARAAEVSEATVFNYFRTKEDLVFERLDGFWIRMVEAVEHRSAAHGIVDAVEGFLLGQRPIASTPQEEEEQTAIARLIATTPALLARERASYDRAAILLGDAIARTTALGPDAAAAAQLILGVHRTLVAYARGQILTGAGGPSLARRVAARTRRGYALLRRGLSDSATRPEASS